MKLWGMEVFMSNVKTYKFLRDGEVIKELHTAKVVSCGQGCSRVVEVCRVDVSIVSILGPDTHHLVTKYTARGCGRRSCDHGRKSHDLGYDQVMQ